MNLSNNNKKESKISGISSLFGKGSVSKLGKSQFSRSMGGIMERLKGLSRKDLAMVGVGLSVLVAAPVAEYMMSKPSDSANMLTSGFSSREAGSNGLGSSPYEPGINALSQGSADGAGEVITPLSARDPMSLILGASPEQPAVDYSAAGSESASEGGTSTAPDMEDMRDSVTDAARNGASEAVRSAGAPTVIPRMMGGMSGINIGGNGTSSSGDGKRLNAPNRANVFAKQSKMVSPVASAGYKGAANTPKSADKGALEKLRAQGQAQGNLFSGASAIKSLDEASAMKMNAADFGSGFGGSGFGGGAGYKNPANQSIHNSHRHAGECNTLACIAAKKRQDKALEWELFWKYDIWKKLAEAGLGAVTNAIGELGKKATEKLIGKIFPSKGGGPTVYVCLKLKNENLEPNPIVATNLIFVAKSSDDKVIGSWGKLCTLVMRESDYNKITGVGGNDKPQPSVPTGAEVEFNKYVKSYDEGLQLFMHNLALVRKHKSSNKGITAAEAAIDSFTAERDGAGFGAPFSKIYNLVAQEARTRNEEINEHQSFINTTHSKYNSQKAIADAFITTLEAIKKDPEKYAKKIDGGNNITAKVNKGVDNELVELVDKQLQAYKNTYEQGITVPASSKLFEKHIKANEILAQYVTESSSVNQKVHGVEYKGVFSKQVSGLKTGLSSDKKTSEKIKDFLVAINGATVEHSMDTTAASSVSISEDNPMMTKNGNVAGDDGTGAGAYYGNGKIFNAPSDDVPASGSPSGKARVWRGFDANFGTGDDVDKILSDKNYGQEKTIQERYTKESENITKREQAAWVKDSPLDSDGKLKSLDVLNSLGKKSNMRNTEFYAPSYRIIVEIAPTVADLYKDLTALQASLDILSSKKQEIIAILEQNGITIEDNGSVPSGNDDTTGGWNHKKNTYSVCKNPNNCSRSEIKQAEREAAAKAKYSGKNKKASPVWNEYKNLSGAMNQDDPVYNNATGAVHTLRREWDALTEEKEALKPDTPANKARLEEINRRIPEIEAEVKTQIAKANARWEELCKEKYGYKNACKTNNPESYVPGNHGSLYNDEPSQSGTGGNTHKPNGNGNTHKPNGNGNTHKPNGNGNNNSNSNGNTHKPQVVDNTPARLPEVLRDIKFVNTPAVVPVYDSNNKTITVDICDGLYSKGTPSVCWAYSYIRKGANNCFLLTEKDMCNYIRDHKNFNAWPKKQEAMYGKLFPRQNRKLDGREYKRKVTGTVSKYSLAYGSNGSQPLPRKAGSDDKYFGTTFSSEKRLDRFVLRTYVDCQFNKSRNKWLFKKVTLTAETGNSTDTTGISLNVGTDAIPGVKINLGATYSHSQTNYNFGKEMDFSGAFAGKICK